MIWTTRPRSDFGTLAAISEGNGLQVLLLHGVGLQADAWAPVIDGLKSTYHVIAPDMPGHGQSPRLDAPDDLTDYSLVLAANLTQPTVLVGHSMGAMIALDIALNHSKNVVAVGALNAIFERSDAAQSAVMARAGKMDGITAPDPTPTLARWFGKAQSTEKDACRDWLLHSDPEGYRDAYKIFASHNGPARDLLALLECPALFMTGSEEPNSTPLMSHRMAEIAPQGHLQIVNGAAHMMPMTHPDEVVAALHALIRRTQHA